MDKNKKIGFAVIGYGGMGSWHASTCADDFKDTAELIGIYDIKPERRAAMAISLCTSLGVATVTRSILSSASSSSREEKA